MSGAWRIICVLPPDRRCGILKVSQAVCHSVILITSHTRPTYVLRSTHMWSTWLLQTARPYSEGSLQVKMYIRDTCR